MTGAVPVVDLFSGPGGLAEGFAAYRDSRDQARFRVLLSVEMERSAYQTLRLRAFLRKFEPSNLPSEYYGFLNDGASDEPDWRTLYPKEWLEACDETLCQQLGTRDTTRLVQHRVREIRKKHGGNTVLLGGPPCQSYSLVGRARNAGNEAYDPDKDERQSLYDDYVSVLRDLQPAVAIMENVKGMLSARHLGEPVFDRVTVRLRDAGGKDRYRLYALASDQGGSLWEQEQDPKDFLVRAENYGVPQARHRVFVVCVRKDIADQLPQATWELETGKPTVSVHEMIGDMPKLRSRLSRGDSSTAWKATLASACDLIQGLARPTMTREQRLLFDQAIAKARRTTREPALPYRGPAGDTAVSCPTDLRQWIIDEKLSRLPNNETRGHIPDDLTRYLFAAAFSSAMSRSPKSPDFPAQLAPKHANWKTGKFGDRFRVQLRDQPCRTVTSHISKDGHYFIHPDPSQCRSITVREAARLQTFPDNYFFCGSRTQQYVQVGNAVPPYLARQIAGRVFRLLDEWRASHKRVAAQVKSTLPSMPREAALMASPEPGS